MFGNILNIFKKKNNNEDEKNNKNTAKERLHLVLMQDRANVSADFLDMMKQEIIEVIKKYIDVDENQIDVKLTNKMNGDGTTGAPALYANIPIKSLKNEIRTGTNKTQQKDADQDKEVQHNTKKEENYFEQKEQPDVIQKNDNDKEKEISNNIKTEKETIIETAQVVETDTTTKTDIKSEYVTENQAEKEENKETNIEESGNNEIKKDIDSKETAKKTTFFKNIKVSENKTEEE